MFIDMTVLIVIFTILLMGLAFYFYFRYKTIKLREDLDIFKQAKEYVPEALLVLSENNEITFANQAAKSLFNLDSQNRKKAKSKDIKLKSDSSDPLDFFEYIEQESQKNKDTFQLENILLVSLGAMKKVNIYVDKSSWYTNKTITCIIDMNPSSPITVAQDSNIIDNNKIDIITGLPNQFVALLELNTLVRQAQANNSHFSLLLFGLNDYRKIRAIHGIISLNVLLKEITQHLQRLDNLVSIYKMDCSTFLLVFEGTKHDHTIIHATHITKSFNIDYDPVVSTTQYPEDGHNAEKLIDTLYRLMYEQSR